MYACVVCRWRSGVAVLLDWNIIIKVTMKMTVNEILFLCSEQFLRTHTNISQVRQANIDTETQLGDIRERVNDNKVFVRVRSCSSPPCSHL